MQSISRQGRITLPELLRRHADLEPGTEAVVVGVELGVEIWEAGRFNKEMAEADRRDELKREREFEKEVNER